MDDTTAAETTGAAVRAECARRSVSQRELARRMGVSHTYVTKRTAGIIAFNVTDLARIASILGISARVFVADSAEDAA